VRVAKVGTEIQARVLAKVPPADLEICQGVFDAIERELDTRLDIAAPAAE
jgi:MarR family transcriptional regulator, transcriptional regulator for hemolysin